MPGLSGKQLAKLDARGGSPLFVKHLSFSSLAAAGSLVLDGGADESYRIVDVLVHPTANAGGGTVQLRTGTTAISNAIACASSGTIGRAASIDQTYRKVDRNGQLNILAAGATISGEIFVVCVRE